MKVVNFLKRQMTDLVRAFNNAKVSYEYDELARVHTIEVLPQSVFDSDEFAKWEWQFFKTAFLEFPGEDISFISEDSYVGMEHIEWSLEGFAYASDDMLVNHISQNTTREFEEICTQNLVDYKIKTPTFYNVCAGQENDVLDFVKADNQFIDSIVLNNNATVMTFDDSLLQAA